MHKTRSDEAFPAHHHDAPSHRLQTMSGLSDTHNRTPTGKSPIAGPVGWPCPPGPPTDAQPVASTAFGLPPIELRTAPAAFPLAIFAYFFIFDHAEPPFFSPPPAAASSACSAYS